MNPVTKNIMQNEIISPTRCEIYIVWFDLFFIGFILRLMWDNRYVFINTVVFK